MNCILVPTLGLDISLLERLANSIDYPVRHKVVINNGKNKLREWWLKHQDWKVISWDKNLGVAGSWNKAPLIFAEDAWLIINDDHELQPGCLEVICKAADEHYKEVPVMYMNQYQGFDMFVWTRKGVEEFGFFDENFYPAYYEDLEMKYRFNVKGAKPYCIGDENFPIKHGKGRSGGERYNAVINECGAWNREYFTRKWGVCNDTGEAYAHPFGNMDNSVRHWTLEKKRRAVLEAKWNEFLNVAEPSIYT